MSRIFTIGTRKRCTRTLEQQARKAQSDMVNKLNQALIAIGKGEYAEAYGIVYNQYNKVDYGLTYLNSALNNIGGQQYDDAVTDIQHAIEELK